MLPTTFTLNSSFEIRTFSSDKKLIKKRVDKEKVKKKTQANKSSCVHHRDNLNHVLFLMQSFNKAREEWPGHVTAITRCIAE
jgi:hypothetical protein